MSRYYYVDRQGWQHGPVEKDQLKSLGVTAETLVWCEGMPEWRRAAEVADVAALFQTVQGIPLKTPPPLPGSNKTQTPPPLPTFGKSAVNCDNVCTDPGYPKPKTYLWLGILTTILCCLPFGIVSIVYGSKVDTAWYANRYEASVDYSNKAKNWGIAAAVTGFVVALVYVVVVAETASRYPW